MGQDAEVDTIDERWSADGLTLTIGARTPDGNHADMMIRWATPELARQNAPAARRRMLEFIARRSAEDIGVLRHYRNVLGIRFMLTTGYRWRWRPQVAGMRSARYGGGLRLGTVAVMVGWGQPAR